MERDRCELLAPAGSKEAFIAAVESGADAIYVGGTLFNARMNAKNLNDVDLAEAIAFAHKRGVKVYVTVNTLIKDSELASALEYCRRLDRMGADGLIIQDLGLGRLVRDNIPGMPIHLSTQGSVYDLRGVKAAEKLGYSRVVLERQLTFDEVREVCAGTDVEIELFCHGALCFCYSGQCQLSRSIGGRSANRGECAQPCRMEYRYRGEDGRQENGFLLSPADSCLLEHLDELVDAGVASLKIEGRMKSPEYVAEVVSIYRKRLDEHYARKEANRAESDADRAGEVAEDRGSESDAARLAQIFSRGFTDGFYSGKEDARFMSGSTSKNRGVRAGFVSGMAGNAGRSGGRLIKVRDNVGLSLGDGLEIRRKEAGKGERPVASCLITYLDGKAGGSAGSIVIGDVKPLEGETVRKDDIVYRISEKAQLENAALAYRNKDWHSGKYSRKAPVPLTIKESAEAAGMPNAETAGMLRITCEDPRMEWSFGPFERAADISGRVASAFGKTGGTPFDAQEIRVDGEICLAIPMSALNEMRRSVFADLEEALAARTVRVDRGIDDAASGSAASDREEKAAPRNESPAAHSPCLELFFYDTADLDAWMEKDAERVLGLCAARGAEVRALIPAVQMAGDAGIADRYRGLRIVPYISANTLGKEERLMAERFAGILKAAEENGVYVGNLGTIEAFSGNGVRVYADYGMNIYNEESVNACAELGAEFGSMSLEAADRSCGAYPLMVTRHRFSVDRFTDRKGAGYRVITPSYSDNSIIVSDTKPDWKRAAEDAIRAFDTGKMHRVYLVGR